MNNNRIIISLLITVLIGHFKVVSQENLYRYNVEFDYLNYKINEPAYCEKDVIPNDSLPLVFEAGFYGDSVEIVINQKRIIKDYLRSNESTGLAGSMLIDKFKNIEEIRLRFNTGKWIVICTERKCQVIGISIKSRNTVLIKFYNFLPHYI